MARVEIEQQISFFSFGFARVSEVRHMYTSIPFSYLAINNQLCITNPRL